MKRPTTLSCGAVKMAVVTVLLTSKLRADPTPHIMGEEATKALPPAKSDRKVDVEVVLAIAERLDGKNWKSIQDELRALAKG